MFTLSDSHRRSNPDQQTYRGRRHALASVSVVDLSSEVQFTPNFVIGRLDDHVGSHGNTQSRRHHRNKHQRSTRRLDHPSNQLLMLQGSRSQYAIDQHSRNIVQPDDEKINYARMSFKQHSENSINKNLPTYDVNDVIVDNGADDNERLAPTLKYSRMLPLISNHHHHHRSRRHMSYHDDAATHRSVTWPAVGSETSRTHRSLEMDGSHVTSSNALDCESLTLPRIEEVLKSEGVESLSISEQINKLKHKIDRLSNDYPALKVQSRDSRIKHRDETEKNGGRLKPIDHDVNATPCPHATCFACQNIIAVASTSNKTSLASSESNLLDLALKREEQTLNTYRDEIERTRWLTCQHIEIVTLGPDFTPPRIVLVSSNFSECETLRKFMHKSSDIITIVYNFDTASYESILGLITTELNAFRLSAKARSLLLLCRGGVDHLFMIKKRVLTVQKLMKDQELISFWKQLSESISRINPEEAVINILSSLTPNLEMKDKKRSQNLSIELSRVVQPNNIQFALLDISSEDDKQRLGIYFDLPSYERHVMMMSQAEEDGDESRETAVNTVTSNQRGVSPITLDDDIIEQVYQCNLPTSIVSLSSRSTGGEIAKRKLL